MDDKKGRTPKEVCHAIHLAVSAINRKGRTERLIKDTCIQFNVPEEHIRRVAEI